MTALQDHPRLLLCLLLPLLLVACHPSPPSSQSVHSFAAQGVIEHIALDRRQVTIHHDTIPGYMIEMTMDFPVDDPNELTGFVPGDKVTFTLLVDQDRAWVNNLHRIGHIDLSTTNAMPLSDDATPNLKPGAKVPDAALMTESGKTVHLSDFRGNALAFTFFFTRCPLPNYCPLMNRNFAETRKLLLSTPDAPTNWQLLSISFDSDFDRPDTLSAYAESYRGTNADRWLFASASPATLAVLAPRLGLMIMGQDASTSHNLRTVVVDPQGRLYRQFNDNLWTPQQLADAIREAAHPP